MPDPEENGETVDTEEEEEELKREEEPSGGPSPVIIIIAAVVVLVLVIGGIYLFAFSGSEIESVAVGNITRNSDDIQVEVRATPSGIGEYSGNVAIEIYFEDQDPEVDEPLYQGTLKVNDGYGMAEIPYEEFVWGNGDYTIYAKGNGKESSNKLTIRNVITSLYVEWQGVNSDSQMRTPDYQVEVNVTYEFGDLDRPFDDFPRGYDFSGNIAGPSGSPTSFSSSEFASNLYKLQKRVDHENVGEYTLTGTLTNTFCKSSSPYRAISVTQNGTYTFDAHPFAIAGDDITQSLEGNATIVNFDGSNSWDDGTIVEYEWDFGDNTTGTGSTPTIQHTYTETGVYYVTLMVTDNKGQTSTVQSGLVSTLSVTIS